MEKRQKRKLGYAIAISGFAFLAIVVLDAISGAPQLPVWASAIGLPLTLVGLYLSMENR